MIHTIDLFYKSFKEDFWLLYISLETIKRNVTGYNQVVVLIPENDKEHFDTSQLPERTLVYYVAEYGSGYLYQQVCKLQAHKYCFSEFILFADSDCIWDHPINLQDFVADGKPEILYTDWSKVDQAIIWKAPTEAMMGEEVKWETMRRNGLIYYRSTIENINKWQPNLEVIVMGSERFSEFNLMGSYAMKYEPQNYTFINTDDWEYVPPKANQIWSKANKEEGASELHLREYIRTLEAIMQAFNVTVPKR